MQFPNELIGKIILKIYTEMMNKARYIRIAWCFVTIPAFGIAVLQSF